MKESIILSKSVKILTLEILLEINDKIRLLSLKDYNIEYRGWEEYPTKIYYLKKLIVNVPNRDILEIAAYYLKNIILLQAFPDANHRTALVATRVFLELNDYEISYTSDEAYGFQTEYYKRRLKTYGTYEEISLSVLKEEDNNIFFLCLNFIKNHLNLTSTS